MNSLISKTDVTAEKNKKFVREETNVTMPTICFVNNVIAISSRFAIECIFQHFFIADKISTAS